MANTFVLLESGEKKEAEEELRKVRSEVDSANSKIAIHCFWVQANTSLANLETEFGNYKESEARLRLSMKESMEWFHIHAEFYLVAMDGMVQTYLHEHKWNEAKNLIVKSEELVVDDARPDRLLDLKRKLKEVEDFRNSEMQPKESAK